MVARFVDVAEVRLWGHTIGAVYWDREQSLAAFEYEPAFRGSGIEIAPLMMPLGRRIFRFPELARTSFRGLPGLLADSLPDDFGNAVIDQWLIREGRDRAQFSPVERLCYIGQRGIGALEYRPAIRKTTRGSVPVQIDRLVELAQHVLDLRDGLQIRLAARDRDYGRELDEILRVGTSAGGARAKAVIAWNPESNEIRSGQVSAPAGFEYWILKFDGVSNRDHGIRDPLGYGQIEYAYHLMATAAGIDMMECRILREHDRNHFMTRRFDRLAKGDKLHMQSLCAIAHLDNQLPGAHSYEQAFSIMRQLGMSAEDQAEQFRRMVFNVAARNQDDHTKNIAYLMDQRGRWRLSPAFDVTFAYNPEGIWTSSHQMTVNGKRDNIDANDLAAVARRFRIRDCNDMIHEVGVTVRRWPEFAKAAGLPDEATARIGELHRNLE